MFDVALLNLSLRCVALGSSGGGCYGRGNKGAGLQQEQPDGAKPGQPFQVAALNWRVTAATWGLRNTRTPASIPSAPPLPTAAPCCARRADCQGYPELHRHRHQRQQRQQQTPGPLLDSRALLSAQPTMVSPTINNTAEVHAIEEPNQADVYSPAVAITPPIPPGGPQQLDGRPLPLQLRIANRRAPQCSRGRGADVARGAADTTDHCAQRERARPDRAQHQQHTDQHQDQAGRRDRAYPGPQVHPVLDPARRVLLYPPEEAHQGRTDHPWYNPASRC